MISLAFAKLTEDKSGFLSGLDNPLVIYTTLMS